MAQVKKLVMISGLQGAGKTTIATKICEALWSEGRKAVRLKFANPLYEMHDAIRGILKKYDADDLKGIDGYLLQLLGTEWGRNSRSPDLWVRCLVSNVKDYWRLNPDGIVVVDDCRFENEYRCFGYDQDVVMIQVRLVAPRETRRLRAEKWRDNENHASETGLDGLGDEWFDVVADTSLETPGSIVRRVVDAITSRNKRASIFA